MFNSNLLISILFKLSVICHHYYSICAYFNCCFNPNVEFLQKFKTICDSSLRAFIFKGSFRADLSEKALELAFVIPMLLHNQVDLSNLV